MRTIIEAAGILILLYFGYLILKPVEPEVVTKTEVRFITVPPIVVRAPLPPSPPIVIRDTVESKTGEPTEYERIEEAPIEYRKEEEGVQFEITIHPYSLIDELNITREFIAYQGLWPEFVEYRGLHLSPRKNIIEVSVQLPPLEVQHTTTTIREGPSISQRLKYIGYGILGGIGLTLILQ